MSDSALPGGRTSGEGFGQTSEPSPHRQLAAGTTASRRTAFDLSNKVALVTQAYRPLMAVVGGALEGAGADVVWMNDHRAPEINPEPTLAQSFVAPAPPTLESLVPERTTEALVHSVARQRRGIDILVHQVCPPASSDGDMLNLRPGVWELQAVRPLREAYALTQAVAQQMVLQGRGGRILFIAPEANLDRSILAAQTLRGATEGMARGMARELRRFDINVNVIMPGCLDAQAEGRPPTEGAKTGGGPLEQIPKGRLGSPADLTGIAVFLASDESDYCTGATFHVDGGYPRA